MSIIHTTRRQTSFEPTPDGGAGSAKKTFASRAKPAVKAAKQVRAARGVTGISHIVKKELIPFTRQSGGMLNAGMSIVSTIGTLEEQAVHPGFKALLSKIRGVIEGGAPFSDALSQYPKIFNEMYVNMVRAGERSGQFADIMRRLGLLLASSARLVRKVKSAVTYPLVVLSLSLIIAAGLIVFIVPVFRELFDGFGSALPKPTQILVDASDAMRSYWYYIIAGFGAFGYTFRAWARTSTGERTIHGRVLRLPVFGELIQKVVIARFARLFGQMLKSGVPILDAISITARSTGNRVIESSLLKAREGIQSGMTVADAMEGKPFLPVLMIRMIGAGEKSGRLDEMLENVADSYDEEVETMLATFTSLIEPFMMVFLGIIVGGLLVAMFLPIFKMSTIIS
jgi:type IV pilus assembly protein PilC